MEKSTKVLGWKANVLFVLVPCLMFSFGFALYPFYNMVCEWLGITGKIDIESVEIVTTEGVNIDDSRIVNVRFVTVNNEAMPWEFESTLTNLYMNPGDVKTVEFRIKNPTDKLMVGRFIPVVSPAYLADHLRKVNCFCFDAIPMLPGEEQMVSVQFFVDPELEQEHESLKLVLYTF